MCYGDGDVRAAGMQHTRRGDGGVGARWVVAPAARLCRRRPPQKQSWRPGVFVVPGGSFSTKKILMEIIFQVTNVQVRASYEQ